MPTRWRPMDIKLHRQLRRVFDEELDRIFGKEPPGKKSKPMTDREFEALLDRIAANGYKPLG